MSDWVVVTYFPVKHLGGFLSTLQIAIAYFGFRLPVTNDGDAGSNWVVELLDQRFDVTGTVSVVVPLVSTDAHDVLVTDKGYLFASQHPATHDFRPYGEEFLETQAVLDSMIQEVTSQGTEVFRWSSWEHRDVMQVGKDCRTNQVRGDYAHINSLQIVDGDIVASFRNCNQILLIDRSGGTGAVKWKLGGSAPIAGSTTEHLELVNDPAGEFCGQHHATLTDAGSVVLFDNGNYCSGPRKDERHFTRAVEYDISSGTTATYARAFALPAIHGPTAAQGGVTVLNNGRWLIAWGTRYSYLIQPDKRIAISEVDPATGTVHLHLNLSSGSAEWTSYRAYRYPETSISIPTNLP